MMQPKFIPFALPEIGEEEIGEVVASLRSGWITTGPKVAQFESDFVRFLGDSNLEAVSVNSATAGLHLALEAVGIGPGDEVITTTHTFTATAEVIRYLGANPVFVDIDETLCLDPGKIDSVITGRTRAIMPVHFAGRAADMGAITEIARRHKLKIVEDAAHALPCSRQGRIVGTWSSDATVFSFYANKTITTGEGGMLVTANKALAQRARVMRLHGMDRTAFDRYTSTVPSWAYEVVAPGFKYNMTDLAAAMGIHQLRKAEKFRRRREEIASTYRRAFAGLPLYMPPDVPRGDVHAWHLFVVQLGVDAPLTRDGFIRKLFDLGVGCSVHYIPLHRHRYWRETYKLNAEDFPVSQKVYERSVSLPIYSAMTDEHVAHVIEAVRRCC